MKIQVTSRDIRDGIKFEPGSCPIALAIKRLFPKLLVVVDPDEIIIDNECYRTPKAAVEFINGFDRGDDMEPFEFILGPDIKRKLLSDPPNNQ